MKKTTIAALTLAFLFALTGCGTQATGQTQTPEPTDEPKLGEDAIATLHYSTISTEKPLMGVEAITYIGLGYNVLDNTYISPEGFSLGYPILDQTAVKKRLQTANAPSQNSYTIMGTTINSYSQDLSAKMKLTSDYPLFSGSVSSEFDATEFRQNNKYFIKSINGYPKFSEYIKVTSDLKTILDDDFKKALNDSTVTPEKLFSTYGTHLVVEALMGARCTYNYTYSSTQGETSTQVKAKADATYRFISGSASASDKQTATDFLSKTSFQSVLTGGPDVDASTLDNLLKNFPTWVAGLADATPTVYGISNMNSLVPIWELTDDTDRARTLQAYYNQRGGTIENLLKGWSDTSPQQTYIESLIVTSAKKQSDASNGSSYPGYTLINKDLNQGAGGNYIYLWYKTTTDPKNALTDVRVSYGDYNIGSPYTKNNHDLNEKAGGKYIYLWTTKDTSKGNPIKAIDVYYGKNADVPSGYTKVDYNFSGSAAELNAGAGGSYIYLGIEH